MTAEQFRQIALSFPGAEERAHMSHPDFRANGKVFATLGYPDEKWGMVKLPADQQQAFVEADAAFVPAKGAWGRKGSTTVRLSAVKEETLRGALTLAWQSVSRKNRGTR